MARRKPTAGARPSTYDSLIDAERDALLQAGRKAGRNDLGRALIDASDLSPRDARRAVASFIDRRGGSIPPTSSTEAARTGWIDGLLDAERQSAARDDRPVTRKSLIRAVLQASEVSPRDARLAVADYLYRRGGQTPRSSRWWFALLVVAGLGIGALVVWTLRPRG